MAWQSDPIHFPDEAATGRFAARLAPVLKPGDTLLLEGEIGAGKSFLARALIHTLCGAETEVPSPTFTLVQTYQNGQFEIWHADLYRLSDPEEAVELGLIEAFESAVCLVEWPDRLGPYHPATALKLSLEARRNDHRLVLSGPAPWPSRLAEVLRDV